MIHMNRIISKRNKYIGFTFKTIYLYNFSNKYKYTIVIIILLFRGINFSLLINEKGKYFPTFHSKM